MTATNSQNDVITHGVDVIQHHERRGGTTVVAHDGPASRKVAVGRKHFGVLDKGDKYGVPDLPAVTFVHGSVLPLIRQTTEDWAFVWLELDGVVRSGIYDNQSKRYALGQVARGWLVSSAFTVWKG